MTDLRQTVEMPEKVTPVVIFGSGSIVTDAHLPAYRDLKVPVAGIYDPDLAKAKKVAGAWGTIAFETLEQAASQAGVVFDLAVPPAAIPELLEALPDGAIAVIQKPLARF